LVVFGRNWLLKVLGVAILAVPHVIGAPQPEVHSMLAPEALEAQFKSCLAVDQRCLLAGLGPDQRMAVPPQP